MCWGRPGEAGASVGEPLRKERMTADDCEGFSAEKRRMNSVRGRGDGPGNELAQRAVVFLMDARATR